MSSTTQAIASDAPTRAAVDEGLLKAQALPVGQAYAQVTAGASAAWGVMPDPFLRGELGWHPLTNVDAFAYGQANLVEGWAAGLGVRYTF